MNGEAVIRLDGLRGSSIELTGKDQIKRGTCLTGVNPAVPCEIRETKSKAHFTIVMTRKCCK